MAERQEWFFNYLAGQRGIQNLMQVYPAKWGTHHREGGYDVDNPGNLHSFLWPQKALADIEAFKPDILYCQQEAYCESSKQLARVAKRMGARFVMFVWENQRGYGPLERTLLEGCALVVCGSTEAEALVKPHNPKTLHCVQVGVNVQMFHPSSSPSSSSDWRTFPPEYDVIYNGRMAWEKGVEILREAVKGTGLKVLWPEPGFGTPYVDIPARYRRAKVHASPSMDTRGWKEQHSNYSNLEALATALYVATSDSSSIVEGLRGCPGVMFCRQGDALALKQALFRIVAQESPNYVGMAWVVENYSYEVIAQKLIEAFRLL